MIGWILLGDVILILVITGFGLLLSAMKIPIEGNPMLALFLGEHGLLFNLGLGALIVGLIPLLILWVIALIFAYFKD